ncbi:MAG: biotin--[acetyl-CoA-carboxylase] ligase, partial [Bdellovibrionota bacterium]|nr:biotin--[acetyl-CoA-carboxylase] ligase [Bdellovibrionota bacterium]
MYHEHFETIDSTQLYLKNNYSNLAKKNREKNILISSSLQSKGIGRHGNSWDHYKNSLAFSFSLEITQNKNLSILPLNLSVYLIEWLETKTETPLSVKWPNDIIIKPFKKCGGILCNYLNPETMIVGIGLNYGNISFQKENSYKTKPGVISKGRELSEKEKKDLPLSFYEYLLKKDYNSQTKLKDWERLCAHLNHKVRLTIGPNNSYEGLFKGLSHSGEAIIED